ncbi:MAG: hypothetical protein KDI17_10220 [Halioglobus sp.]|nr:hypothetical protein [Halioglobus sp.]
MQATVATYSLSGSLTPEHLFVTGFFLLSAVILFALSVEAGNYPEIRSGVQSLRQLKQRTLRRLRTSLKPRDRFSGGGQVAGR